MARWGLPETDPATFAQHLFTGGALAARLEAEPGWRPALARLVFAPPAGLPRAELPEAVDLLLDHGLAFALDGERLVAPWQVIAAAAPLLAEAPPLIAAALGRLPRHALARLATPAGLDPRGDRWALVAELFEALHTPAAIGALAETLSPETAGHLMALVDAGGRPVDPDVIGESWLRTELERMFRVGLVYAERGAFFVPLDLLDPLAAWRMARLEADFATARRLAVFDGRPADLAPPDPIPIVGALRGAALLDVYAARHGEHRLLAPEAVDLWQRFAGQRPPEAAAALRRVARHLARPGWAGGLAPLDAGGVDVDAAALRRLIGGYAPVQAPLAALFGVEPWARDLLALRGARGALAERAPELWPLIARGLDERLRAAGLDIEQLDALIDAVGRLVGQTLSLFTHGLLTRLAEISPARSWPEAVVTDCVWQVAQSVTAARWQAPTRFARRFGGRSPIASHTRLIRPDGRGRAEALTRALRRSFFEPLELMTPLPEGRVCIDPRLRAARARLSTGGAVTPVADDRAMTTAVEREDLIVGWPAGGGAIASLMACVEQGRPLDRGDRVTFAVPGAGAADRPGTGVFWSRLARWRQAGVSPEVEAWIARHRPRVLIQPGVTVARAETAADLDALLADGRMQLVDRLTETTAVVVES